MTMVRLDYREASQSDLPRVCMYCGRTATHAVRRTFSWTPWWAVTGLMRILMRKTMIVGMPVCDAHGGSTLFGGPGLFGPRAVEITNQTITITKIADEFADALYDYRRGKDYEDLGDEEYEDRRRRRVESDQRTGVGRGSNTGAIVALCILGVPLAAVILFCGIAIVASAFAPRNTNPGPNFPPLPPLGQPAARPVRPEEVGLLAVAPDADGLACLPWPALALNLRKEPLHLLADDELDKILIDLTDKSIHTSADAAEKLAQAYPDEHRRAEVARALEQATTSWDVFTRQHAATALAKWATPDSVPALIKLLSDHIPGCRAEAMNGLAALKDERGAAAVAQRLTDYADRAPAQKALEAMGPAAEKPVLPLLTHTDRLVRHDACNVLKAIGTKESVPGLEKVVQQDKDRQVKQAAQDALKAIQARP
jgi:HEAT repeats